MATNLRLSREAEEAVRREAERSGRSQQEVIRDAIARQLGIAESASTGARDDLASLISSGTVRAPRSHAHRGGRRLLLPDGVGSVDLLNRDDRI
jgi:hypothetical protein